ncbi:MAG: T9SS type A sorting domain-containing protein [Ignavibacteria bacterium]
MSSETLKISVYPIGAIFNADMKYKLECKNPTVEYKYIYGGIDSGLILNNLYTLDHDASGDEGASDAIGYGKYRVVFYTLRFGNYDSVDYCDVDYSDSDYPYTSGSEDITFYFYSDSITFSFSGIYHNIQLVNKSLKIWDQYGTSFHKSQNKNGFITDSLYNYIPINAVDSQAVNHIDKGDFSINFNLINDMFTRNVLFDTITNITVKKKAALVINSGKTFNMITPSLGYNNLIIEDSALLNLSGKIIVNSPNKFTLKKNSILNFLPGSEIRIRNGGVFCNEGSNIRGNVNVVFDKGIFQLCSYFNDFVVEDSTKIVLEDSAVVVLPDNYTLHLKGNTTSLIMNPGSKIKFGENSGIVCDSGAKVIANDAAFTSTDSTKKWNGISLKHRSQDTIKNCLISNANYGIMIFRKNDDEETEIPYSTEISGCSFVNKSGSELSIAIYAANSNNFLIMNNSIYSTNLTKGFAQGIYTEFCSGGDVNFIGNTINNTGNGMTLVNSSPFVSQNIINGNQYSESGIFLDNSNGKFEYNIINDFYYSVYSMLSSPDLLKNIFNNSYTDNILLTYSSTPNLQPVLSGGNTYWLSGDNLIDGEPSNAGIFFEDDSYPNMAYGYNRFTLSNNTYNINGTTNFTTYFDIRENYWGTLSPDTSKLSVENSLGILYSPFDDNSSGQRSVNNYTLYDIGFGLKDTVFYLEGDNPGMANELYIEAYQKENSGEFSDAIEIYKEIITDYKDSLYAVSSLSRLFNCHEKKNSTVTEFNLLQNYYSDIFEDTTYSETQRNLSEDFMIKTKVKQNNIEGAVSDYNTIYTNNMNTTKGTHALINMEILSAGTGDNLSGSNEIENLEIKQNRINDILSSVINKKSDNLSVINKQPERFLLSQNYPNPFNPTTKIMYSIPVSGNVAIKIFDITGREIKSLLNEFRNAGSYEVEFDGSSLASGVYYYKLETNNFSEIKKMILIK